LHDVDGMRGRSSILRRLAFVLAVLCATSVSAHAASLPPDWEPGCSPVPLPCMDGGGDLKLDVVRHSLQWKWTDGGIVSIADVSNPTLGDRYDFCVYDASSTLVVAAGLPSGGICAGRACWRARSWGFQYRDPLGSTAGFTRIDLRVASRRRDRFLVQAGGAALPMPASTPEAPVVVQLVRTHEYTLMPEACWTSTHSAF
jgi:hypothetical protein